MLLYRRSFKLPRQINCERAEHIKLSRLTTYGLGGMCECYFPRTPYSACRIYEKLRKGGKVAVIGNGSDILASDYGFDGGVICLKRMRGILPISETEILCLAGTNVADILAYCKKRSIGGMEYMYGIPASIGGAAYMNAGVGQYSISQNIVGVKCFGDFNGFLSREKCNFGYRHSTMCDINCLILSVKLRFCKSSDIEIRERTEYFKNKRRHLPKGKSCGCVFKNGENYSAGELIDRAGFKGLRRGNAYVSEKHADFIINEGDCAADVKYLIDIVKRGVLEQFGVRLHEEVVYIGEFNDFNG